MEDALSVEDVLATFLLDMDDLAHCTARNETRGGASGSAHASQQQEDRSAIVNNVKGRRATRKRIGRRQQITALEEELNALTQQLKQLNQERLRHEEMIRQENAQGSPRSLEHWKQQAQQQQTTRQSSEEERKRLVQFMETNQRRIERIREVLVQQMALLLENPQLQIKALPDGDSDTFVYRMLKNTLDGQHTQLDLFLAQCVPTLDPMCQYESSAHDDGAGIDVRSAAIYPFHVAFVNEAFQRYTQELPTQVTFGCSIDGNTFFQRIIEPSKSHHPDMQQDLASSLTMRVFSIMRRIVCEKFVAMVWASMVECHDNLTQRPTICKNGWSIVKPMGEHGHCASFTPSIESINVYQSDGSARHPIDTDTGSVLKSIEHYVKLNPRLLIIMYLMRVWRGREASGIALISPLAQVKHN